MENDTREIHSYLLCCASISVYLEWRFVSPSASPSPSSWQGEIAWHGAFRNSLKVQALRVLQNSGKFHSFSCVIELELRRERMGSTGQQPWRLPFKKRHLCRNSPRMGEILEDKAKPFNMLELCRPSLNVAYVPSQPKLFQHFKLIFHLSFTYKN